MKLQQETLEVLNNFAIINSNIVFNKDKVLRSVTPYKNLMSKADIPDQFPYRFGIYDLSEFLSALSMFEDPDLSFDDDEKFVFISDGKLSLKYYFSEIGILTTTEKDVDMPDPEVEFKITHDQLSTIRKASSTLRANEMVVKNDNGKLQLVVTDTQNPSSTSLV